MLLRGGTVVLLAGFDDGRLGNDGGDLAHCLPQPGSRTAGLHRASRWWSGDRVTGEDGKTLLDGDIGELWMGGPMVMREYWRDPDATAHVFADGWFRIGDMGAAMMGCIGLRRGSRCIS